jgi:UDP-glucose 4-epimerase
MRVLITGGAGFIGSNLAHALVSRNHSVTVLDDLSTGDVTNLAGLEVELIETGLRDSHLLRQAVDACDVVVHLAARGSVPRSLANPLATHRANVDGTLSLLEILRESPKHLIFSSSSSVYGANKSLPKNEELWVSPVSPYGASKLASESYVLAYQASFGIPAMAFRFFNVYGPRQKADHDYAAVVPKFIWNVLRGAPVVVNGDGTQTRDFTYVDTVIDILTQAIENKSTSSRPINLALGKQESLLTLIQIIKEVTGLEVIAEFGPPRGGDVMHSQNDPSELRRVFPKVLEVSLREGVAQTTTWLKTLEKESLTAKP